MTGASNIYSKIFNENINYEALPDSGSETVTTMGQISSRSVAPFPAKGWPRRPRAPAGLPIPRPGSDGSYAGDNYFQYINVPAHKTFEWGYRRGNPEHNREEYLSQKDHTFKAKVKGLQGDPQRL